MESGILSMLYFGTVIFLYYYTTGFTKKPLLYRFLKVIPVVILALYSNSHRQQINAVQRQRFTKNTLLTIYFVAYIFGDLIRSGNTPKQLANAAFVYTVGHIFYMLTFLDRVVLINKYCAILVTIISCIFTWNTIIQRFIVDSYSTLSLCIYIAILSVCLIMSSSLYLNGSRRDRPKKFEHGLRFFGYLLSYLFNSLIIANMFYHIKHLQRISLTSYFIAQYLLFWCIYSSRNFRTTLTSDTINRTQFLGPEFN